MSRPNQVKNRAAAAIQVTAEQILREASDKGLETVEKAPSRTIRDNEELLAYQQDRRKDFENQLRRSRQNIGIWIRYALWESEQKEFERARSIFERALDTDPRCEILWLKYSEMEMKNSNINHARNIYDRVTTILPRIDKFWYKYTYMEELVGEINRTREIFTRWMEWEPNDQAWLSFIKFEIRYNNIENARQIYEKYIKNFLTSKSYIKYAKFEENITKNIIKAREIFTRGLTELHPLERNEDFLLNFAKFEERNNEIERSRMIFQYLLEQIQLNNQNFNENSENLTENSENLYEKIHNEYLKFEKRNGNINNYEEIFLNNKKNEYEKLLLNDNYNYDLWLDFIRLEENEIILLNEKIKDLKNDKEINENYENLNENLNENLENLNENSEILKKLLKILNKKINTTRENYNKSTKFIPLKNEKRYWLRYIYLWINWALFEELIVGSINNARNVYKNILNIIPHKIFTFGKIWLYAAELEIRDKNLTNARKILGNSIGLCGKKNLYENYINIELKLGEIDRCREIYIKYINKFSFLSNAWLNYIKLENNCGEIERVRSLYELCLKQNNIDIPEIIWKSYIEWEINQNEINNARELFIRLLKISSHLKIWISFAQFELSLSQIGNDNDKENAMEKTREIFDRGYTHLRSAGAKEERAQLLEAWRDAEAEGLSRSLPGASHEHLTKVEAKLPRKVKVRNENGDDSYDYIFPDDEKKMVGIKLLEKALKWKDKLKAKEESEETPAVQQDATEDTPVAQQEAVADDQETLPIKRSNPFPEDTKDSNEIEFD